MAKNKRKAISKKLRFEIFKRDSFTCSYCGRTPPSVVLEIDHIEPVVRGGDNNINNLITACFDCNRGKSSIPLEKIPNVLSENLEILKEKESQLKEYRKFIKQIERRETKDINDIAKIYCDNYEKWQLSETFKKGTIKKFLSLLPKHIVADSFYIAISRFPSDGDAVIKYFCGICWNRIKKNDNGFKIQKKWEELSRQAKKGVGYSKKEDAERLKNMDISKIEPYMVVALSERRSSYWAFFIQLLKTDGVLD